MRDLIVTAAIFATIPFILRNPFVGLLTWVWVGIMNPHRLAWGFAYDMPFAGIVAACTLASTVAHLHRLQPARFDRVAVLLILFVLWLGVSPLFSFHPELEFDLWSRAVKIQVMGLLALLLVHDRRQLHRLAWVLALSIAFYGIKGGLFTIASGGAYRVWGPTGSFIADNNQLALAIIMGVPLLRYLQLQAESRWARAGYGAAMVLGIAAALGSQSRGGLLALLAIALFLYFKSRHKGMIALLALGALPVVLLAMPETWFDRMATIGSYQEDASAMGRINAWHMAWNLAVDRFPIGGGFAAWQPDVYLRYAPDPGNVLVAHSIYFHILGDHGFVGLALFLAIFGLSWRNGSWILRETRDRADLQWARDLAAMCQVSLVGYAVGGAFLSLTYFDLPYYIVIVLVALRRRVALDMEGKRSERGAGVVPAARASAALGRGVSAAGRGRTTARQTHRPVDGAIRLGAACACLAAGIGAAQADDGAARWPGVSGLGPQTCGALVESGRHGPFDYRNPPPQAIIDNVERNHFNGHLAAMLRGKDQYFGAGGGWVAAGFGYTLHAFPNHHRALRAMDEYSRRKGFREAVPGAEFPVECYFERAIRFRPDDVVVRYLYADYLDARQRRSDADAQIALVLDDAMTDPGLAYNVGLFFANRGHFDKARRFARVAYQGGYDLPGLKAILVRNGQWDSADEGKAANAAGPRDSNSKVQARQ